MKKFLMLIVLAIGLSSCYQDVQKSVANPAKETTSYLQNLPKDTTVTVAYEGKDNYVFDKKTNLLKYKTYGMEDDALPIGILGLLCFTVLIFSLGAAIGASSN